MAASAPCSSEVRSEPTLYFSSSWKQTSGVQLSVKCSGLEIDVVFTHRSITAPLCKTTVSIRIGVWTLRCDNLSVGLVPNSEVKLINPLNC